jgi:zinc transport system permease protein
MPWPFEREYMQMALAGGLVVGVCAPLIGAFLVQRRMSLVGDGVGHVAFAGVAAGLLAGVWPVWTALAAAIGAALGMEHLRRRGRASGDVALALIFYTGIAAGVVLVGLAGSFDARLFSYLFGSILTVDRDGLVAIVVIGAVVVGTVVAARRALFGLVVDEEWATVAGLPTGRLNAALAVLAAITIVAAMRIVGLLLVAALMVLPVASAQLVSRSFRATLWLSSVIGAGSVVAGLAAARAWGLAPGATIVLVCAAVFVVTAAATGRRVPLAAMGRPD